MQVFSKNGGFLSNLSNARNFSLGDPTVICRILSDHLYSNKIGSIVRELSANALDAHREAGNESKPFEVHVPGCKGLFSKNDSAFFIRDYGPGLSEKGIYSLYTSYGSSNKRDDSLQIGGFGIGSKSPFAYVNTFEVVSWHKGLKSQYVCFQDESGTPCVKKLSEEESAEPNGLQVKFTVTDTDDFQRFAEECQYQYAWYRTKPNCNVHSPELKPVYENEWGMCVAQDRLSSIRSRLPGDWYTKGCFRAVVNNSVYSISELYGTGQMRRDERLMPFTDCICLLKIPGDQVDISASREELAFTDRTASAVKNAADKFVLQAFSDIWSELRSDAEKSMFEAMWKWNGRKLNPSFLSTWIKKQGYSDCGIPVDDVFMPSIVPLDSGILRDVFKSGVKAYEIFRRNDWNRTFSAVQKMTTVQKMTKNSVDGETGGTKMSLCSKHIRMDIESIVSDGSNPNWRLMLSGCPEFRLVFVPKGTSFSVVKEWMKNQAGSLPSGGIIQLYAVDDPAVRQSICEAYGRPDADRIFCPDDLQAVKPSKKKACAENASKREKVKVRMAHFNDWSRGCNLLDSVRTGIPDEWHSVEEIENFIASGAVLIVTCGTEISERVPATVKSMMKIFGRVSNSGLMPSKWVVMNDASYAKWLSLGGRKIEEDDALQTIERFFANLGIGSSDFENWCYLNWKAEETKFSQIENACSGDALFEGYLDTPAGRAWSAWNKIRQILKSCFYSISFISESLFTPPSNGGICSLSTGARLQNELEFRTGMDELRDWVCRNPILNLLDGKWTSESNRKAVAETVRRYLKWM